MHSQADAGRGVRPCRRNRVLGLLPAIIIGFVLLAQTALGGGGPQNVLVVIDDADPDSLAIGEYYVTLRDIPECNVLRLNAPVLNTFNDVINNLATPIKDYVVAEGIGYQIDYIVLTKGIPYKFSGRRDSVSSILFSEETDTWPGECYLGKVELHNPYAFKAEYFDYNKQYERGTIPLKNRRLVMMLSGFTVAGAMNNIDSGVASDETMPTGTVYMFSAPFDPQQPAVNARLYPRHDQIAPVRAALMSLGVASAHFVVPDEASASLYDAPDVMGYLTGATRVEVLSNTYLPGAIADHLTSFGGDLLNAGGQMSILEFTDEGVAGSSGTVTEPCNYAQKFANAQMYERYAVGFNQAESIWMSLVQPWQTIIVGDPLAQPWAVKPVVNIFLPQDGTSTTGLVELSVEAMHPRGDYLSRMELYVDGKLFDTLADLSTPAGNEITLTANGTPIVYTTAAGDDAYDILKGLKDNAGTTPGVELFIPAETTNGRAAYLKVLATTAGSAGNGIPVLIDTAPGAAADLGVTTRLSDSTLQGGMNAVPADEVAATQAQVHVFASVGRTTLSIDTTIDLSALPEGPHELRVVAYQGDFVFTQGYAKVTVIRSDSVVGDIDGDGHVYLTDFATFALCYGFPVTSPPPGCSPEAVAASDMDGNGFVNLSDFATFAVVFGR
ncbi:MAG: TIGR03790 family protein [Phycisphaerales bacterium]|nr:MAG: TIGR03790 family protein [Phycisphaerales bacterium]